MRLFIFLALLAPAPVLAASFDRPIPQAQSATAELWFALASLALFAALVAVALLVARR
ncbi:hypothetical protein [Celeribacter indicus]|uniref:Protein NnrT n=1 Tax=Celeribacter indicus TaxID=1208324 RepID=A0A0B5DQ05_9RHOB|nr:hypothetical protein [Celeribacter indicus]AJE45628.1 hypothetical protein P73_0913 [Celeribacter indicus]SDW84208.1 hypothetical protein SAMN05443573_10820 [Celeribacter indicus]